MVTGALNPEPVERFTGEEKCAWESSPHEAQAHTHPQRTFEVVADRLADIFTLMAQHDRDVPHALSLCQTAVEITELSGAGISLSSPGDEMTSLCTSDRVAKSLMELEMIVGEGPALDVTRSGEAVSEPNLAEPREPRWPVYTPEALTIGARAVFGFPVRVGGVRFGALSLYRVTSGPLSAAQVSDGHLMASVIARAVLAMQAGASEGELLGEFHGHSPLDFRVHQAAGMLAVQSSTSVKDALVTLRAYAFSTGTDLSTVADRVVKRMLRFNPVEGGWIEESSA